MVLVLDKSTIKLDEVQNSCSLFISLCKLDLDLEGIMTLSTQRRVRTYVLNIHILSPLNMFQNHQCASRIVGKGDTLV